MSLIFNLIITIIVEFFVYYLFIKKDISKLFLCSVLINSFTLPIATYSYYTALDNLIIIEILVWVAELFLIKWLFETNYSKSVWMSLSANLITYLIGIITLYSH